LHRKYHFPVEEDVSVEVVEAAEAPLPHPDIDILDFSKGLPKLTITRKTTLKRWFEGCFTYYLPKSGFARDWALTNHMVGLDITPEVMWELTPWSWAADWVVNTGVLAKNASAFSTDGLVMPYAYMMEHKTSSVSYQLSNFGYKSYPGKQVLRQTFVSEVKSRRTATPFGFGLSFEELTPRQVAILTALGMSRGDV
jgi:hypothetical protein